jgi:hypothetical protein
MIWRKVGPLPDKVSQHGPIRNVLCQQAYSRIEEVELETHNQNPPINLSCPETECGRRSTCSEEREEGEESPHGYLKMCPFSRNIRNGVSAQKLNPHY